MTGAPKGTGSLAGSTASSRAPRLRKPGKWRRPWPQQRTSRRAGQPSAGTARTRRAQAKPDVAAVPPGTTDIGEGARPKRGPKLKTRTPPQNGRDNGKREHLIPAPHPQPWQAGRCGTSVITGPTGGGDRPPAAATARSRCGSGRPKPSGYGAECPIAGRRRRPLQPATGADSGYMRSAAEEQPPRTYPLAPAADSTSITWAPAASANRPAVPG